MLFANGEYAWWQTRFTVAAASNVDAHRKPPSTTALRGAAKVAHEQSTYPIAKRLVNTVLSGIGPTSNPLASSEFTMSTLRLALCL